MDSSETNNDLIAKNLSDSDQIQDSTIFSYISDLSPIKLFKGAPMAKSFPGHSYSPQVFTSPRINPQSQSSPPERPLYQHVSNNYSKQNDDENDNIPPVICTPGNSYTDLSYQVNSHDISQSSNSSAHGKCVIATESVDKYLKDLLKVDCDDAGHVADSSLKQSDTATPSCKDFEECINYDLMNVEQHDGNVGIELLESTQLSQLHKCGGEPGVISSELNTLLHGSKASQQISGMPRRCIQYEKCQQNTIAENCCSMGQSHAASISSSFARESRILESSCATIYAPPNSNELEKINKPTSSACRTPKFWRSGVAVSKPSGIGLHLNSIINALPMGRGASASAKSADEDYMIVQGKKSFCTTDSHSTENAGNSPTSSEAVDGLMVRTREMEGRSCASAVAASTNLCPRNTKPMHNPVLLQKPMEHHSTSCDKREYAKLSPRMKRKISTGITDGDGCKRCNCKKTKCLKLYCDCFAAGYYCTQTCSCQGCFNSPEYENTVLDTRRQIVSRDPLAFAPKILQRVGESPTISIQDINKSTPSSARHKRGCNCKKSMCLKRYCECYQSNIGCSDGCRCAGCQNVYGKKEECDSSKHIAITEATNDVPEISFDQKLYTILHSEPGIPHDMTNDASSQPCPKSGSFSLLSSCQLSSPPITSVVPFGENKLPIVLDSDSRCYNMLEDDDIPEILKEDPISLSEAKGRSPNKKRVSPPHSRFRELRPGSSITGLRSGRKYILKAVPSFPPLAPCIDVRSTRCPSTNAPDS